jgi:glycerophosphoryl diester phosphodiesterase
MRLILLLLIGLLLAGCSAAPSQSAANPTQPAATAITPGTSTIMPVQKTLNIAHRGARSIAPENTLLAAKKGYEIGADLWELDVAMSSDKEIVVIHDDTLERTSNASTVFPNRRPWKIEDFTFAELRTLDFGSWYVATDPFKAISGGTLNTDDIKSFAGLTIPTLREALEFTKEKSWRVNVEIKDLTGKPGDSIIVEKVVSLIQELGLQKSVIISSFNHSYIARAKKADASIYTAALVETSDPDPVALLAKLNANAYNPSIKTLDYSQIAPLRAKGLDVNVWTVNDEATMRKLITAGVAGIFTDYPQILKKVLDGSK